MFEGKHIHYSPTDNKPLCSYSGKICRQRRLNGYAFCIRHILEDKSAPFKQCSFVTRNNSQKCLNAIPANQDRGYCHSHMQVAGIIPKTERKPKAQPPKAENSSSNCNGLDKSSPQFVNSLKKDPGAVFKFEEESSEIKEVYSYKNGISNGISHGKGKNVKIKEHCSSLKDGKNGKLQNSSNSSLSTITSKKVTDKNKNLYTTLIPATNNTESIRTQSKNRNNGVSITEENLTITRQKCSPRVVHLSICIQKDGSKPGSELKSHNTEDIRQFEQLKALKQVHNSLQIGNCVSDEEKHDVNLKFPRLAASSSIPKGHVALSVTKFYNHSSTGGSPTREEWNSEIVLASPAPPLITRSNNGIVIKTEQHSPIADIIEANTLRYDNYESTVQEKQYSDGVLVPRGNNRNSCKNNFLNSIDTRDLKSRREFLAQVRDTFKSQYKTIKKACIVSETCEKNSRERFRDSLMQCIRIDSSICAQVLSGYGFKLPKCTVKYDASTENEDTKKDEYDKYEFFDNDDSLTGTDHKIKKSNSSSIGQQTVTNDVKKGEDANKNNKGKAQRRSNVKEIESSICFESSESSEKEAHEFDNFTTSSKNVKITKKLEKCRSIPVGGNLKESKPTTSLLTKKKIKRGDAVVQTVGDSKGSAFVNNGPSKNSCNDSITSYPTNLLNEKTSGIVGKKRKLETHEVNAKPDLGLALSSHSSPSICNLSSAFDMSDPTSSAGVGLMEKCTGVENRNQSTAHRSLSQCVGNSMNEVQELNDILTHSQLSSASSRHNHGLETVLNSVGSSENAGTPDGVITDASFDSTFEHSTSSQPECEFSEDDLEHSFELQIDPEIESQASRLLEDNVLTEADFTELFPDNRMSDHKFGRNDLQELGMTGLEFDVNDIDYSLFANIFPNFPRANQPESISISNQF